MFWTAFFKRVLKFRLGVLVILFIFTLAAIPWVFQLRLSSKITEILPDSVPQVRAIKSITENYNNGGTNYVVLIESNDKQEILEVSKSLVKEIQNELTQADIVMGADTSFTNQYGLWLADEHIIKILDENFKGISPSQILSSINSILESEIYSSGSTGIEHNKFGKIIKDLSSFLSLVIDDSLSEESVNKEINDIFSGDPLIFSPDGTIGFFTVSQRNYNSFGKNQFAFAKKLKEISLKHSSSSVSISIAGSVMLAFEESQSIIKSLGKGALFTALIIIVYLVYVYRDLKILSIIILTILISLVLSTGIISVITSGSIHIVTGAFLLLIIGMGVDFSVHFIDTCFVDKKQMANALALKMPSIIIAAGSTCIVFVFLAFTGITPLQQLGWVVALGIFLTLLISSILVPILMVIIKPKQKESKTKKGSKKTTNVHWFASVSLFISLVISAFVGIYFITSSEIERDIRTLNQEKLISKEAMKTLKKEFNINPAMLTLEIDNISELDSIVNNLLSDPLVKSVDSPSKFLIDEKSRRSMTESFTAIYQKLQNANNTDRDQFKNEIHRLYLNLMDFSHLAYMSGNMELCKYIEEEIDTSGRVFTLNARLQDGTIHNATIANFETIATANLYKRFERLLSSKEYKIHEIPSIFAERYFPSKRDSKKCLVYVDLHRNMWNPEVVSLIRKHLSKKYPGLTNTSLLSNLVVEMVLQRGSIALILGVLFCFLFLLFFFRSLYKAFLGIVPILIGICHVGYVFKYGSIVNTPFMNYISVCSLLLIAGIGLDYAVHALSSSYAKRYRISKVICISGATTIISFMGLASCNHAGLQGLGLTLTVGLTTTICWCLLLLHFSKGESSDSK